MSKRKLPREEMKQLDFFAHPPWRVRLAESAAGDVKLGLDYLDAAEEMVRTVAEMGEKWPGKFEWPDGRYRDSHPTIEAELTAERKRYAAVGQGFTNLAKSGFWQALWMLWEAEMRSDGVFPDPKQPPFWERPLKPMVAMFMFGNACVRNAEGGAT
jgi:hypothetical protein